MKRLLLFILFASVGLAQIPSDTLVTKLAERDTPQKRFLREHPGAVEVLRNEHATHYRNTDGTFTAVFSPGINYVDADSQIVPVAPQLWQTDVGFRQIGTASTVRIITTSNNQDTIEVWNGTRVATVTTAKLTKTGDFTWTFPWSLITWTLEVLPDGWQITSQPIVEARGVRNYQMPLASTGLNLVPDADGNLVDGTFRITRALMIRADGVETPCSAWTATAKAAGFTCDDTGFPAQAYPYVIDPTGTYVVAATGDDVRVHRAGAATWPVDSGTLSRSNLDYTGASDSKTGGGATFSQNFSLFRWDTSGITTNKVVTSASLSLTNAGQWASNNSCLMYFDWISAAIWPIGTEDWVPTSSFTGDARSGDLVSAYPTLNQTYTMALSNVSNVNRAGYTAIRYGIRCASQPTHDNYNRFYTFDQANAAYRPTLTVVYQSPPATVSATPNSGTLYTGPWYTFTFQVSDEDGYGNLNYYHLLLAYGVDGTNACWLLVNPNLNVLSLLGNDNATWTGGYAFGSANTIENNQCKLDYATSTLTNSGNNSTAVKIQFKPTFSYGGWTKHSYVWVLDTPGVTAGWTDYGSWTLVPGGPKLIIVNQ